MLNNYFLLLSAVLLWKSWDCIAQSLECSFCKWKRHKPQNLGFSKTAWAFCDKMNKSKHLWKMHKSFKFACRVELKCSAEKSAKNLQKSFSLTWNWQCGLLMFARAAETGPKSTALRACHCGAKQKLCNVFLSTMSHETPSCNKKGFQNLCTFAMQIKSLEDLTKKRGFWKLSESF